MILQECSDCDRQYDVTHLAPGKRVRCVCDHVLTVRVPNALTVGVHKCENCGGAVEPGHEACPYCGAALSPLDLARSTLCPRCFTRLEDDARHCKSCGVAIEPQALTPLPEGKGCSRCRGELRVRSLAETSVIECGECGGMWVRTEVFATICKRAQNRPDVGLHGAPDLPIKASEPERKVVYIPCLVCGELMLRKVFRYKGRPSHVVVDYCKDHGVWFDKQELERIVDFVRSRANVEQPFRVEDALSGRLTGRRPLMADTSDTILGSGLGTWLLLDGLGDLLGTIVTELFD